MAASQNDLVWITYGFHKAIHTSIHTRDPYQRSIPATYSVIHTPRSIPYDPYPMILSPRCMTCACSKVCSLRPIARGNNCEGCVSSSGAVQVVRC